MTPKPEIAAIEAAKHSITRLIAEATDYAKELGADVQFPNALHTISLLENSIATLSNHVVITEGGFAGIDGLDEALEEFRFSPVTYTEPKIRSVYEAAKRYHAIAQNNAPEGK